MGARFFDEILIRAHSDTPPSGASVTAFKTSFSATVTLSKLLEKAKLAVGPEGSEPLGDGTKETISEKVNPDFTAIMSYSEYVSLQTAIYGNLIDIAYIDSSDEDLANGGIPYAAGLRIEAAVTLEGGARFNVHITGGKAGSKATNFWSLISS